ncbi:unnamed protein product [Zymoseptoria tritici ST99CH_3D1]|nr:unnamed protein product [Zymoseptoria tritici ST99CH_3D1]
MAKGTVDWNSAEAWERAVACLIATGAKIDYRAAALHFGCTYDTLENRFRKTKKLALELKGEVERGERDATAGGRKSAPATPRKPKTPKKDALTTVTQGRVAKSSTPKSNKKAGVKQEMMEEEDAAMASFDHTLTGDALSHDTNYEFNFDTGMDHQANGFDDLL